MTRALKTPTSPAVAPRRRLPALALTMALTLTALAPAGPALAEVESSPESPREVEQVEAPVDGVRLVGTFVVGATVGVEIAEPFDVSAPVSVTWTDGHGDVRSQEESWELPPEMYGATLTATVTGTSVTGEVLVVSVRAAERVGRGTFATVPVPTVSGTWRVGSTLTATTGRWVPEALLDLQWLRDGAPIAGATSATYVLVAADRGTTVSVQVSGSAAGYLPEVRTSAGKQVQSGVFATAPTPTTSGAVRVGSTVKARTGSWSPGATFSYQWRRNGTSIKGATSSSYRPVVADLGTSLSVRVTAKRPGFTTLTRTSAASKVGRGVFTAPRPTIRGTAEVGATLTAVPGTWSPSAKRTYQWKRDGKSVKGATKSSYKLTGADYNKKVTVTVKGKRSGFTTRSRTSTATAKVKRPAAVISRDGTHKVGTALPPGTYMSSGTGLCYWERRTNSGSSSSGIITNGWGLGRQIVRVASGDRYFYTQDCGSWTRLTALGEPRSSMGDGVHAVGVHIRPGLYEAYNTEQCFWARLSGFSGTTGNIIEYDYVEESYLHQVRVRSGDKGFETIGCGTWRRISS